MFDTKKLNKNDKVLLIGNISLDIHVTGNVEINKNHESVPLLDFTNLENNLGGNIIKTYLRLKHEKINSTIISYVGPGKEGEIVINKCKRTDVKAGLVVFNDRYTTTNLKIFNEKSIVVCVVEKKNKIPMVDKEISQMSKYIIDTIEKEKINLILFEKSGIFTNFENEIKSITEKNKIKIEII